MADARVAGTADAYRLALTGDAEGALEIIRAWLREHPRDWSAHSHALLLLHGREVQQQRLTRAHLRWVKQHARYRPVSKFANSRDPEKRLRIGYVSADFREGHPVAYFIEPVFEAHDRQGFTIGCYSNVSEADCGTERFQALADEWRDITTMDDGEFAAQVRSDGIDILVDLSGHCAGHRLRAFARRAAPVQVTWLGYPDTTGLTTMDYRLSDAIADPPGVNDRHYTEELLRLDGGFLCYKPPTTAPAVSALPAWFTGHVTFGSFQYPGKITPRVIQTWAEIMRRVPGSRLLLHHCFSDYWKSRGGVRRKITRAFAKHGIAAARLGFAGPVPSLNEHLKLYGQVDIALDAFPYNGTTTTCEALWMGVPVVTLEGETHAGRVGKSVLTRAGLADLVAVDTGRYIEIATGLATDLDYLARIRQTLRPSVARSPLLDAGGFTRSLESAFRSMWRRWCSRNSRKTLALSEHLPHTR